MKKMILATLALFFVGFSGFGADPVPAALKKAESPMISLPPIMKVEQGRLLTIRAETKCKQVKWFVLSDKADLIPFPDGKTAIFSSPYAGKIKILAWTAEGDEPSDAAICVVTVEGDNPDPGPDPIPPSDKFVDSLRDAFKSETDSDKVNKLKTLISIFQNGATTTVNDQSIKTAGRLLEVMHDATTTLIKNDMMKVRDAIRKELDTKLPTKANTTLDDNLRKVIGDQFKRVADALTKVQGENK